jgi:hypothetical protein
MFGSWTQRVGIALTERLCDVGGGGAMLAKSLHDWGGEPYPIFNYILAFALQLRRNVEKLKTLICCEELGRLLRAA